MFSCSLKCGAPCIVQVTKFDQCFYFDPLAEVDQVGPDPVNVVAEKIDQGEIFRTIGQWDRIDDRRPVRSEFTGKRSLFRFDLEPKRFRRDADDQADDLPTVATVAEDRAIRAEGIGGAKKLKALRFARHETVV